jgi:hypothetical protein
MLTLYINDVDKITFLKEDLLRKVTAVCIFTAYQKDKLYGGCHS